jgi:EF-P beta-lysylation protein EpmB
MSNWQQELSNGFGQVSDLLAYLNIDVEQGSALAEQSFKTKVPIGFAQRMKKGDLNDPLLKQVLAVATELDFVEGYVQDPLKENLFNPLPGLIHKYSNRVLLTLSGACAVHCRYCFRRHFPYHDNNPGKSGILKIIDYLHQHPQINEVIFSGGDPLILNNQYFAFVFEQLKTVKHIRTVRMHSRIPIVLPSRIEPEWLNLLKDSSWHKVMVTHANHPQELDASVSHAVNMLKAHGWTVLNQQVLLAGVNDSLAIQVEMSHRLFDVGILPYYLHLLDEVHGAAHFNVPLDEALNLYKQMQASLSGYLLPKLAKEIPNVPHKTLLGLKTSIVDF